MARTTIAGCVTAAALLVSIAAQPAQHKSADAAVFDRFWAAHDTREAAEIVGDVVRSGVTFDEAYGRLKEGRPYTPQKTGMIRMTNRTADGIEHHYALNVPETYDPAKRYRVRFQLHGGVMMRHDNVPPSSAGGIGALAAPDGNDQIYVVPFAWNAEPWWSDDQILNLRAILDRAKRLYNIDENRVIVSGVSDGGTGAYYVAMRETTPFASFLPLNGFLMVLAAGDLRVDGPLYPNNLRNKPFFIVNGERDPLYPTSLVDPYIAHFRDGGITLDYRPQNAGHNTSWWPQVKEVFEAFVRDHPRRPLPDTLTWETTDTTTYNRAHWLVIDRLGRARGEANGAATSVTSRTPMADLNDYVGPPVPDFGVRTVGARINRVIPGSNAERLGLKNGDVLVRLNDEAVRISVDVQEAFEDTLPGTPIKLLVARDNQPVELEGQYEPEIVKKPPGQLFDRFQPSGRVDVSRTGNTVSAATRGVAALTLLLSPEQFDFGRPVTVVANGRTLFDGRVQKDVRTLLKWAAIDNDRTMLFGAEIHVDLTR
jgi:hypothetical protein